MNHYLNTPIYHTHFCSYRSNLNYELNPKPRNSREVADERTVHNILYTTSSNGTAITTSTSLSLGQGDQTALSSANGHVYATVGNVTVRGPDTESHSSQVAQHTLLHSTLSDDASSHAYSKPNTPLTKTAHSLLPDTQNYYSTIDPLPDQQPHNYSTLNGAADVVPQGQGYSEVGVGGGGEYSQLDESHKYFSLEVSLKGYSQLDVSNTGPSASATPVGTIQEPVAAVEEEEGGRQSSTPLPYEVPFTPSPSNREQEDATSHAYSTLTVEVGDTGYSKLHVFEEATSGNSQRLAAQQDTGSSEAQGRNLASIII